MAKGPGTNKEQIASLKSKLTPEEIKTAEHLVANTSHIALTLAYKLMREKMASNKPLSRSVVKALTNLSEEGVKMVQETVKKRLVNLGGTA